MGRVFNGTFAIFLSISSLLLIPNIAFGQSRTSTEEDVPIFFNFTLLVPDNSGERQATATAIVKELSKIGIDVDLQFLYVGTMGARIFGNMEDPVPTYVHNETRGFDAYIVNWFGDIRSNTLNNFGYLDLFPLSTFDEDTINILKAQFGLNPNYHNYYNDSYVNLLNAYYKEFNTSKRLEIFKQALEILYDDLPAIGIYSQFGTAVIVENWELSEKEAISIYDGSTPSLLADLKFGTGEKLTIWTESYRQLNPLDEDDFLTQFVFQPLYENDVNDPTKWVPLLAESLPVWNENRTEATIKIRGDVFFADGHQLDTTDVKESFNWYLEPMANPQRNFLYRQFHAYTRYFNKSDSIEIIDPLTIKIKVTEPYIFDMNLLNAEIIPYHVYGSATNNSWFDINSVIFDDLLANSTSEYGFGTGPYTYGEIKYDPSFYHLTLNQNPNYWNGNVQTEKIIITRSNPVFLPEMVSQGDIELGFINFADPLLTDPSFKGLPGLRAFRYNFPTTQWYGFNMIHPIFGTGEDTPLGLENPDKATRAARYIRKAINHAIPRPFLEGVRKLNISVKLTPTPIRTNLYGYNTDLEVHEYNLTKSKAYMELAGYEYPKDPNIILTDPINTKNSNNDSLSFEIDVIGPILIMAIVLGTWVRNRKNKIFPSQLAEIKRG